MGSLTRDMRRVVEAELGFVVAESELRELNLRRLSTPTTESYLSHDE